MRAKYLRTAAVAVLGCIGVVACSPSDASENQAVTVVTQTSVVPGTSVPTTVAQSPAASPTSLAGQSSSAATPTPSSPAGTSSSSSPVKADGRPASNVPMTKLKPGEKAPQFVIFSFDGAGSHDKWAAFMEAAKPTDSRFVGFLTGIYLLTTEHKDAYTGPGHDPGKASIGFGGTAEEIITEVEDLNKAYAAGHEIGTHYNGHFCKDAYPGGDVWTRAQWSEELSQFFGFMRDWQQLNNLPDAPKLQVPTDAIKGGRTPCLTGEWDQLVPAWKEHGLTYDSSINAPHDGISWPEKKDGIWEFYMPTVYSPGFKDKVLAMDYNFWVKFNNAQIQPETAPQLREIVAQTYEFMWDEAYNGSRAPILIANHFNDWNGDSFNPPAMDFMKDKCGRPDTYCATYQDVIAWMELQDPAVLAALQKQAPVAGRP